MHIVINMILGFVIVGAVIALYERNKFIKCDGKHNKMKDLLACKDCKSFLDKLK